MNHNCVENTVDTGKNTVAAYKRGTHGSGDSAVAELARAAYQLYYTAEIIGRLNIVKRNVGYSLGGDLFGINVLAEAQSRQYADLAAGVVTLNVGRRIAFGKAFFLREGKRRGKVHIIYYHFI